MRYTKLVVTLLVLSLLTGCQWIEPTAEMHADIYRAGVMDGCITTMYVLAGPPPSDESLLAGIQICQAIANEIMAEPLVLPTTVPGSTL